MAKEQEEQYPLTAEVSEVMVSLFLKRPGDLIPKLITNLTAERVVVQSATDGGYNRLKIFHPHCIEPSFMYADMVVPFTRDDLADKLQEDLEEAKIAKRERERE